MTELITQAPRISTSKVLGTDLFGAPVYPETRAMEEELATNSSLKDPRQREFSLVG